MTIHFSLKYHFAAVCRIDVDTDNPENVISTRDIPDYFRDKANMTERALDCTWVAYANRGQRVRSFAFSSAATLFFLKR